jgi:hypothetical protein
VSWPRALSGKAGPRRLTHHHMTIVARGHDTIARDDAMAALPGAGRF